MQFCGQDFPMDTKEIDCVNESIESLDPLGGMENLRSVRDAPIEDGQIAALKKSLPDLTVLSSFTAGGSLR